MRHITFTDCYCLQLAQLLMKLIPKTRIDFRLLNSISIFVHSSFLFLARVNWTRLQVFAQWFPEMAFFKPNIEPINVSKIRCRYFWAIIFCFAWLDPIENFNYFSFPPHKKHELNFTISNRKQTRIPFHFFYDDVFLLEFFPFSVVCGLTWHAFNF